MCLLCLSRLLELDLATADRGRHLVELARIHDEGLGDTPGASALDRKARNRRTDKARRTGDENPIRHRDQAAAGLRMNLRASRTMRGTKLGRSRRES